MNGIDAALEKGDPQVADLFVLQKAKPELDPSITSDNPDSALDSPVRPEPPVLADTIRVLEPNRQLLIELYELNSRDASESNTLEVSIIDKYQHQWIQTTRWIRYMEKMGDKFFKRPRVPFLSVPDLVLLRRCLAKGIVLLDVPDTTLRDVSSRAVDRMLADQKIGEQRDKHREDILKILMAKRVYGHDQIKMKGNKKKTLLRQTSQSILNTDRSIKSGTSDDDSKKFRKSATTVRRTNNQTANQVVSPPIPHSAVRRCSTIQELPTESVANGKPPGAEQPRTGKELWAIARKKALEKSTRRATAANLLHQLVAAAAVEQGVSLTFVQTQNLNLEPDAETAQIMLGGLPNFDRLCVAIVRLSNAVDLPESVRPSPTRFVVFVLGSEKSTGFRGMGTTIGILMSSQVFKRCAYAATNKEDLLAGIDTYFEHLLVIPAVDLNIRQHELLSLEDIYSTLRRRKYVDPFDAEQDALADKARAPESKLPQTQSKFNLFRNTAHILAEGIRRTSPEYDPFKRTGIPFYGLAKDVKRRLPFYASDYRDAWNLQCVTALLFMFFACFAPAIAFGGLMGEFTQDHISVTETLLGHALGGILWNILAVQPLIIPAITGPLLLFESGLYEFSVNFQLDFLAWRLWVAIWIMSIAAIVVMLELTFIVKAVTRFTEDIFATMIAMIFIVKALHFMDENFRANPVEGRDYYCAFYNGTDLPDVNESELFSNFTRNDHRPESHHVKNRPDTALLSLVVLTLTCALAYGFRILRTSHVLSRTARRAIGDFGVALSMVFAGLFAFCAFPNTKLEKLHMAPTFDLTNRNIRPWMINPLGGNGPNSKLPVWAIFAAIIPGLLAFLLIFAETVMVELLLSRPQRQLRKACSYHYDILLAGVIVVACSFFGFPWMCAATVQSISHVSALTVMKPNRVPGEVPKIDYVIEQRVTGMCVALLLGSSASLGVFLGNIPMAVLFGVFLYLGIVSLLPIQFVRRLFLIFIPAKYYPREQFCQEVVTRRMHMFTAIQFGCLLAVWLLKTFKQTALAFPFGLLLVVLFRRYALPKIYSQSELNALDGDENEEDVAADSGICSSDLDSAF